MRRPAVGLHVEKRSRVTRLLAGKVAAWAAITATVLLSAGTAGGFSYDEVVATDAPRAYWPLGEAAGALFAGDASGNGVTGTYYGPTLGMVGAPPPRPDTGASFDGTDDFVDFGDVLDFAGWAPFSLEAWVYVPTGSYGGPIMAKRDHGTPGGGGGSGSASAVAPLRIDTLSTACGIDPGFSGYYLAATNTTIAFARQNSDACTGAYYTQEGSSALPALDRWHHVVGTYDGTSLRLYVNGALVASGVGPNTSIRDTAATFKLGRDASWQFSGRIDNPAVYNRALSPDEVKRHYESDQATITFTSAEQIEQVVQWTNEEGIHLLQSQTLYPSGDPDETVTVDFDFETTPPGTPAQTATTYETEISDMFDELATELAGDEDITQAQRDHAGSIDASIEAGNAPVHKILARGSTATLAATESDPLVAATELRSDELAVMGDADTTTCESPWWPYKGSVNTRQSLAYPNRRFIYQSFRFAYADLQRLKCHANVTYEHEANFEGGVLQNYYLGRVISATSNMPRYYRDTNLLEVTERTWTIGTSDAQRLQCCRTYWTKIYTHPGQLTSDDGHIQAEKGRRGPEWCYSTNCVFKRAEEDIIAPWYYSVPGRRTWVK